MSWHAFPTCLVCRLPSLLLIGLDPEYFYWHALGDGGGGESRRWARLWGLGEGNIGVCTAGCCGGLKHFIRASFLEIYGSDMISGVDWWDRALR